MRKRTLLDGLLAGCLSLAVLWAASRATTDVPFAPVALAERAIRAAPGGLATFSIEQLGHSAVRLLTVSAIAGGIAGILLGQRADERATADRRVAAADHRSAIRIAATTEIINHEGDRPIGDAERVAQAVSSIDTASSTVLQRAGQVEDLLAQAVHLANKGDLGAAHSLYAGGAATTLTSLEDLLTRARLLLAGAQHDSAALRTGAP